MKHILQSLEKGQRVAVSIIEIQDSQNLLVSYGGELFRVYNTSGRRFEIGEKILLVVTQKNPVEFSLIGERRLFSRVI